MVLPSTLQFGRTPLQHTHEHLARLLPVFEESLNDQPDLFQSSHRIKTEFVRRRMAEFRPARQATTTSRSRQSAACNWGWLKTEMYYQLCYPG
jgi:hypothetical protein